MAKRNLRGSGRRRLFAPAMPVTPGNISGLISALRAGIDIGREGVAIITTFLAEGGRISRDAFSLYQQAKAAGGQLGQVVSRIIDARPRRVGPTRPAGGKKIVPFPGAGLLSTIYKTAEVDSTKISGKSKLLKHKDLNRHRITDNLGATLLGTTYGKTAAYIAPTPTTSTALFTATSSLFGTDNTQRYKFQIQDMTNSFMLHNMDRVTAFLEVYVFMPAVDTSISLDNALLESANAQRYTTSTGSTTVDDIDFSPENAYLKRFWRVINKKTYKMPPGHTLRLLYQQDGFYPTNETRLGNATTNLKGQTVRFYFRAFSAPIRDAGGANAVTLGTVDIAITQSTVVNYIGTQLRTFTRVESNEFASSVTTQNSRMLNAQGIASGDVNADATVDGNDDAT